MTKTNEKTQRTEAVIGMGATVCIGSDRYPATIIKIHRKNLIEVQVDNYVIEDYTDGYGKEDSYTPNPEGRIHTLTRNNKGRWMIMGTDMPAFIDRRGCYQNPHY